MSKNACRMTGLLMMLISVFFLIGGLYLGQAGLPESVPCISLFIGLILLTGGVVFYRIMQSD